MYHRKNFMQLEQTPHFAYQQLACVVGNEKTVLQDVSCLTLQTALRQFFVVFLTGFSCAIYISKNRTLILQSAPELHR